MAVGPRADGAGTGSGESADCCIRLRSFCDIFAAPSVNELGIAGNGGREAASSCDRDDVRPVEACAMISRRSVLGPGKGVRVQGATPVLGGVLPPNAGDFGVRGVAAPDVETCGPSFGDGSTLPFESNHTSAGGLDATGSRPRGLVIGRMAGDCSGVPISDEPSSSIANIISFVDGFALREGLSVSIF